MSAEALALELKAEGRKATDSQLAMLTALAEQGWFAAIACGVDDAQRVLASWGLLRGYSARDDLSRGIDACYEEIRERKAAGGPGWPE